MTFPVSLTLHPDILALAAPAAPSLRGGSRGICNAGVVVEIKPHATAAHLRDMAQQLAQMAEGRA